MEITNSVEIYSKLPVNGILFTTFMHFLIVYLYDFELNKIRLFFLSYRKLMNKYFRQRNRGRTGKSQGFMRDL